MKHFGYTAAAGSSSRGLVIMYLLLIAGIAAGAVWAVSTGETDRPLLHQYFLPLYNGDTLLAVFRCTLVSLWAYIIAAFLIGTSTVGQPVGILMLLYRGFGIGLSSAAMYINRGASAFPAVALLILPAAAASAAVSVLAVRELLRSSNSLLHHMICGGDHSGSYRGIKLYCLKFAVLLLISLVISAADTFLYYLFSGLV